VPTVTETFRPKVVSREQWEKAHKTHLDKEKALTRHRDQLARDRRHLPWVKVEKNYVFDTPAGKKTLAELFEGRSQLIVKHFMFGPGWKEGCVGCSFECDHVQGAVQHIENHDVKFVAVARAPLAELEPFKRRMGWTFDWVSSHGSDFNYDFHVTATPQEQAAGEMYYNFRTDDLVSDELSGFSVFFKDENGDVFHTFSSYGRGAEELLGSYVLLDMTPKGRNETGPRHDLTDWVRHHDRYGDGGHVDSTGRYQAAATPSSSSSSDAAGCPACASPGGDAAARKAGGA
jgi:predicted dithiol-disulfide oxidoreductase (DUF899 family)